MRPVRGLSLIVALAACFNPNLGSQPFKCGVAPNECPPEYACVSGMCVKGNASADAGRHADAPPAPDGQANPDGFVCAGGSFLGCRADGQTAIFCNAGGNGTVDQHCEQGCDNANKVCRHCVAGSARCVGDQL